MNDEDDKASPKHGFASWDPERHRAVAGKGGRAAHAQGTAPVFTPEQARTAGRKGGQVLSQDLEHMSRIGKKGGRAISKRAGWMAEIGRRGGVATSRDREHMAEIGRKGGEAFADGKRAQRSSDAAPEGIAERPEDHKRGAQ